MSLPNQLFMVNPSDLLRLHCLRSAASGKLNTPRKLLACITSSAADPACQVYSYTAAATPIKRTRLWPTTTTPSTPGCIRQLCFPAVPKKTAYIVSFLFVHTTSHCLQSPYIGLSKICFGVFMCIRTIISIQKHLRVSVL